MRCVGVYKGCAREETAAAKDFSHALKRLILDARYVNCFDKYESFKYEKLSNVSDYLDQEDCIVLAILKSGYHQLNMHPEWYRFLCIEFGGQVYYFKVLPFGLASACRTYTLLMNEVYRPLRLQGQRLTSYIDDVLLAFKSDGTQFAKSLSIIGMLSALGFVFSVSKCQVYPSTKGRFLGLIVDVENCKFQVPEDKMQYIEQEIRCLLSDEQMAQRQLARIAGLLVSIRPAVLMAPLYTRKLFQCMSGSWEGNIDPLDAVFAREDLQFWLDNLQQMQGKSWIRRDRIYHAFGDASESAFAGHSQVLASDMVIGFSASESDRMQSNQFSSCLRETRGARLVIQTVLDAKGEDLRGGLLVFTGDNQGSIHCLNNMSGSPEIFAEVRIAYESAAKYDVHLEFVWKPRTDADLVLADKLSRTQDTGQIALSHKVFVKICSQVTPSGQKWGFPTCDVFAGPVREEQKASRFFTKFACPKSQGVNALNHIWSIQSNSQHRTLLWVFPPVELIGQTLKKLKTEQCRVILVLPKSNNAYWLPMLRELPVLDCYDMPYTKGLYRVGALVPDHIRQARYAFKAYLIDW